MSRCLTYIILIIVGISSRGASMDFSMPKKWNRLEPILISRVNQAKLKMKLMPKEAFSFVKFLNDLHAPTYELIKLQLALPKTTLELLRAVYERNVAIEEAERIAAYFHSLLAKLEFENPKPFDENTSHIIGRDWPEIDYTGEGITWERQREKYHPYGITNFKTLENIKKFFLVESELPYFKKIYRPKNSNTLKGS